MPIAPKMIASAPSTQSDAGEPRQERGLMRPSTSAVIALPVARSAAAAVGIGAAKGGGRRVRRLAAWGTSLPPGGRGSLQAGMGLPRGVGLAPGGTGLPPGVGARSGRVRAGRGAFERIGVIGAGRRRVLASGSGRGLGAGQVRTWSLPGARHGPGGHPRVRGLCADQESGVQGFGRVWYPAPTHGPPCSLTCPPMGLFRVEGAEDPSPCQMLSPSDEATTVIRPPPH